MTFHQSRNVTVLSTGQQIAFPMTRKGSVFRFRRPLADRNRIDDLPAGLSLLAGMTRAAHAPLRPQMVHQLFFQCAPGLNEQATVNRFVGHAQALVVGILGLQPPGNLFGRPVQEQFTRNEVPQLAVDAKQTSLRPQGRSPSLVICQTPSGEGAGCPFKWTAFECTPCPVPSCPAFEPNFTSSAYSQPLRHIQYNRTPSLRAMATLAMLRSIPTRTLAALDCRSR